MCLPNPGEQLVVGLVARSASSRDDDDVGLRNLAQLRSAVNASAPVSVRLLPG
jgi:hypothetical protein